MYHFSYFKENREEMLLQFLHDHPFAFLTGSFASGEPVATQIPMLVDVRDGSVCLQGHIMRNTDHHRAFLENEQVLAVFTGPHAYVSASWYANPQIGSTWNYMSVYARGKIRFLPEEELIAFMRRLTLRFEDGDHTSPTVYDNLASEYVDTMIKGIAGFELKVDSLENVFKLSQNRDEKSYRNIMEQLEKRGSDSERVAHEMRKRVGVLFPSTEE